MPREPAAIGGEHAIGFEDVAMLAAGRDLGSALEQLVDRPLHRGDRLVQPLALAHRVLGDDLADHDARLVQHRRPDGEARR